MKMKEKQVALKNGTKVSIRTAVPNEADALLDYFKTVCAETDFLALTAEEASAIDKKREQEIIAEYEKSKRSIFLTAYSGNEVIASCTVDEVSPHLKEKHRAKLGVAVKSNYWNAGLGSALVSTAVDFAGKVGYAQIELDTVTDNVYAILLYNKFGFNPVGSFPHAQKIGETYRDCIRFVKYLTNET